MSYYYMEIECNRCKNKIHIEISPPLPEIGATIKTGSCFSDTCRDIKEISKHTVIAVLSG